MPRVTHQRTSPTLILTPEALQEVVRRFADGRGLDPICRELGLSVKGTTAQVRQYLGDEYPRLCLAVRQRAAKMGQTGRRPHQRRFISNPHGFILPIVEPKDTAQDRRLRAEVVEHLDRHSIYRTWKDFSPEEQAILQRTVAARLQAGKASVHQRPLPGTYVDADGYGSRIEDRPKRYESRRLRGDTPILWKVTEPFKMPQPTGEDEDDCAPPMDLVIAS